MNARSRWLAVAILAALAGAAPQEALAAVGGPFNDLRETLTPATNAALRKSGGKGSKGYCLKDNVKAVVDDSSTGVNVRGFFYMSASTPDFAGDLRVTTFYGLDPNPASSSLALAGFDPLVPQAVFSDEVFEGMSGALYPATYSAVVPLADLPTLFPDFDLSPFQGAPSSIFYVFAGTVPSSDLEQIPEPGTLLTAGVAATLLAPRRQRRRSVKCVRRCGV